MQKELKVNAGRPYPLGVYCDKDGIHVSMIAKGNSCGIILYDKNKKIIGKADIYTASRMGKICCGIIEAEGNDFLKKALKENEELFYQLYSDDEIIFDSYMKAYEGRRKFAENIEPKDLFIGLNRAPFDWEGDVCPKLSYEDSFIYCMHVRGFTKHSSSGVKGKGTFGGIVEKLDYLEELGITTLELLPVYELDEEKVNLKVLKPDGIAGMIPRPVKEEKVNYWGYTKGFYYAPRNAYAASGDGDREFKHLVKELHKRKIEVVLQFYFPKEIPDSEILEVVRYWRQEYHVDGFHLKGENIPVDMVTKDPGLSDVKFFYYDFAVDYSGYMSTDVGEHNLAVYKDDYMYSMRKFLKGDEDMVPMVLRLMRHQTGRMGRINYFTNYYGFTLSDMVSYERKHNDANGENNKDGNDYNHTWNCGVEGKSRKRTIVTLREKQIRNAVCMLLLSQGTPLIFMGDEFGNSQSGNNNPYCQDNDTSWLNWKNIEQNRRLYEYVKQLLAIRKAHPILHSTKEFKHMDYKTCGFPDLSYHATKAWQPDMSNYVRHIAMLYCGKYAEKADGTEDDYFYIAMNMHWEPHEFALPQLPKGLEWHMLADTQDWELFEGHEKLLENQQADTVNPRSIKIFISKKGNGK